MHGLNKSCDVVAFCFDAAQAVLSGPGVPGGKWGYLADFICAVSDFDMDLRWWVWWEFCASVLCNLVYCPASLRSASSTAFPNYESEM